MEAITNGMMNLNRQRHQHLVALRIIFAHGENGGEELSILATFNQNW